MDDCRTKRLVSNRERFSLMKTKFLGITLAVLGMVVAASPAHACNGINMATYYSRHGGPPANRAACQAKPEVQVAVLATSPDVKAACPTVSIWHGTGSDKRATHSH